MGRAVNRMRAVHPGEVLREEYLVPLRLSVNALAMALGVPATRMHEIVKERRGVTADTAERLARYFGGDAASWLALQAAGILRERFSDPVAHRTITTLALLPHPPQSRMPGIREIDDPHIDLACIFPMRSPNVLLQCPLPGYGHCQDHGIKRGMIESLADQLPRGEQPKHLLNP